MYLTHISALVVTAFQAALSSTTHPVLGTRDLWVGSEYPNEEANYPGVWATYDAGATLRGAGVGHVERIAVTDSEGAVTGYREGTRWTYSGTINATVVSLTRRDRDELLDEVIRLIAFGNEHPETSVLRTTLEDNAFIALRAMLGEFRISVQDTPGRTPWGSEEAVWEGTVSFDVEGEFVSDLASERVLLPLSAVVVEEPEVDLTPPPDPHAWQ